MYADKFSCDALLYLSHKQNNDKDPFVIETEYYSRKKAALLEAVANINNAVTKK